MVAKVAMLFVLFMMEQMKSLDETQIVWLCSGMG